MTNKFNYTVVTSIGVTIFSWHGNLTMQIFIGNEFFFANSIHLLWMSGSDFDGRQNSSGFMVDILPNRRNPGLVGEIDGLRCFSFSYPVLLILLYSYQRNWTENNFAWKYCYVSSKYHKYYDNNSVARVCMFFRAFNYQIPLPNFRKAMHLFV